MMEPMQIAQKGSVWIIVAVFLFIIGKELYKRYQIMDAERKATHEKRLRELKEEK